MTAIEDLRINGERLWDSLMQLARIGATPKGGVCRLALSDPRPPGTRPRRRLGARRGTFDHRR